MPLSDTAIRTAKPATKPRKLTDGGGLFILITSSGSRWWRLKYRFDGKEKLLSLGTYPDVSLKGARERREEARKLLANGVDPGENRKQQKAARQDRAANSFETIAREWIAKHSPNWAESHAAKVIARLENDLLPWIGGRPIAELTAPELLTVLRRIEARGALDTAHRAHQSFGMIFRYAVATGRADRNPAADLKGALPPARKNHFAAVTDPARVGEILRALHGYHGDFVVRCALQFAPLVFVRPGELRHAEWSEIDLDGATWELPAEKMKMRLPHVVPLSRPAVAILRELYPLTGSGRYVFPNGRTPKGDRAMSDNALLAAMRRIGIAREEMTTHGWRATARTLLDEVLKNRPDLIEHQLAHAVKDPNGRAYNRTAHLPERRKMMQRWADYLDGLRRGGEVVPIRRA